MALRRVVVLGIFLAGSIGLATVPGFAGEDATPASKASVKIGMANSLFKEVPESTITTMMGPFGAVMEAQTGVRGEVVLGGDAMGLSQSLSDNKVQLGVFHGIEFAWAKTKHPELKPLMIAINQHVYPRAVLCTRSDCKAASFGDLQNQSLALPRETRDHCFLFVERHCPEFKKQPPGHFAKITVPANAEDALDDVVDGVVSSTVVDGASLDSYKRRKPGRFVKLRVTETSEPFPGSVIAYRPGVLDEPTLKKFRDGLLNTNHSIVGRQLLTIWKITSFEPVPPDFDQVLTEIVKVYPPPGK
jgi:ABC-type phosphate/phosphonate transport system substrate-binding protein